MKCRLAAAALLPLLLVLPSSSCGTGSNCDACATRLQSGCGWQWQCGADVFAVSCDANECLCTINGEVVHRFGPSCGFYSTGDSCEQTGFTDSHCGWAIPDRG